MLQSKEEVRGGLPHQIWGCPLWLAATLVFACHGEIGLGVCLGQSISELH